MITEPTIPVFVYGTLQEGHWNHSVHLLPHVRLGLCRFVGRARTCEKYPMIVWKDRAFPGLFNAPGVGHNIEGELYLVTPRVLTALHVVEGVFSKPPVYSTAVISVHPLSPSIVAASPLSPLVRADGTVNAMVYFKGPSSDTVPPPHTALADGGYVSGGGAASTQSEPLLTPSSPHLSTPPTVGSPIPNAHWKFPTYIPTYTPHHHTVYLPRSTYLVGCAVAMGVPLPIAEFVATCARDDAFDLPCGGASLEADALSRGGGSDVGGASGGCAQWAYCPHTLQPTDTAVERVVAARAASQQPRVMLRALVLAAAVDGWKRALRRGRRARDGGGEGGSGRGGESGSG